jgi:hypothetical protein
MSITTRGYAGPLPHPDFRRQVADEVLPPFVGVISGEISASSTLVLGVARFPGKIKAVNLSVLGSGKNDTQVPTMTVTPRINGVSAVSTPPAIAHVSGETAQHKSTYVEAADTGITQASINDSACTFAVGDIITALCAYSGNTSPTTKMNNLAVIVECMPLG